MGSILQEIIAFAIEREKEAARFYANLRTMSHFTSHRETLGEFEEMERAHADYLSRLDASEIPDVSPDDVPDLRISDFVVEGEVTPGMTPEELVAVAMKREEKSENLYQKLAMHYKDPEAKKMFTRLAAEESAHKLHFEKIYRDKVFHDS